MRSGPWPRFAALAAALLGLAALAAGTDVVTVQDDGRDPVPWRSLDADTRSRFELGHAVFNTPWVPAGHAATRRDGLGPLFNAMSCDACHNSRRRGRGPVGDGPALFDFVIQVGQRLPDGSVVRGHPRFGHVINTDAIDGFEPEARVSIRYQAREHRRADGSRATLRTPEYVVELPDGAPLPDDLVLMPRMAPTTQGVGLLEAIPEADILAGSRRRLGRPRGTPSWLDLPDGPTLGRLGWQATEPTVAHQTAVAFAREMGLGNDMIDAIDCAPHDAACRRAPHGGVPEVETELFEAVIAFQRLEAVRRTPAAAERLRELVDGERLFERVGCGDCHRNGWNTGDGARIDPGTDLLLHDLGPDLADRDANGQPIPSLWRTAPLWGMSTALEGGRPVRLLHDGRARSIEEAIAWHGGAAARASRRFDALDAGQRQRLLDWIASQ